jgi:hypothetical protein
MIILPPERTPAAKRLTSEQQAKMPYRLIRVCIGGEIANTGDPGMTIFVDGIRMPMIPLSALNAVTEYDSENPHVNNDE